MAFARAMVEAYQARGMSPNGALKMAHITPADVRKAGARITAAQMEAVSTRPCV
jgi:hypothetical protein